MNKMKLWIIICVCYYIGIAVIIGSLIILDVVPENIGGALSMIFIIFGIIPLALLRKKWVAEEE